ncbi:helix-turn-helix domain-containing protein [Dysosmobacter sp.]|uniref:helix-turn-helix domain-containing protein n=1 Tax=Dysosmobacter sp. TaxID=2591382 RepID=UPI002A954076|nr:helix-turn-helix transcriptional regulator [Dysosmobacter sp.]MDY5611922.1 helix-turn-helix transcriptional regulator [Dysosmobacter sp.]
MDTMTELSFGQRLQTLRAAAGFSQEQLAERLDVARQTISKWELGTSTPELSKLVELSELFGVSLDQLARGENWDGPGSRTLDLERLARQNRSSQRRTALTVVGSLCLLLGGVLYAVLRALQTWLSGLQYLLYRYMTAGEYVSVPTAGKMLRFPLALSAGLAAVGISLLVWLLWRRKKK